MRLVAGFLVAPAFPLLLALLFVPISGTEILGPAFFMTVYYSYPIGLILGLPGYLLMRRHPDLKWWQASICGSVVGAAVPIVIGLVWTFHSPDLKSVGSALIFLVYGLLLGGGAGLLFWVIAWPRVPKAALRSGPTS